MQKSSQRKKKSLKKLSDEEDAASVDIIEEEMPPLVNSGGKKAASGIEKKARKKKTDKKKKVASLKEEMSDEGTEAADKGGSDNESPHFRQSEELRIITDFNENSIKKNKKKYERPGRPPSNNLSNDPELRIMGKSLVPKDPQNIIEFEYPSKLVIRKIHNLAEHLACSDIFVNFSDANIIFSASSIDQRTSLIINFPADIVIHYYIRKPHSVAFSENSLSPICNHNDKNYTKIGFYISESDSDSMMKAISYKRGSTKNRKNCSITLITPQAAVNKTNYSEYIFFIEGFPTADFRSITQDLKENLLTIKINKKEIILEGMAKESNENITITNELNDSLQIQYNKDQAELDKFEITINPSQITAFVKSISSEVISIYFMKASIAFYGSLDSRNIEDQFDGITHIKKIPCVDAFLFYSIED